MFPPFRIAEADDLEDAQELPVMGDLEIDRTPVVGPGIIGVERDDPVPGRAFGAGPAGKEFDRMVDDFLRREEDAEKLEDAGQGLLQALDVGHGFQEMTDPGVVGHLPADRGHVVLDALLLPFHAPGEDDPGKIQFEMLESRGKDLMREPKKAGKGF
ncbi:MAG: hypothetical protein NT006_07955 [Candidatus Aminicenantes bacterium]|nr:hypothetical protein [Candidatus Aminicenantes bacterium]